MDEISLRRKVSFRIRGKRIVLIKKSYESADHVAAKALCYAAYLPLYPGLKVEIKIGQRYKPDLVALGEGMKPLFWAECGAVGKQKIYKILHKFPRTHFSFVKITGDVGQFKDLVVQQKEKACHTGLLDILRFPEDIKERLSSEFLSGLKLKKYLAFRSGTPR